MAKTINITTKKQAEFVKSKLKSLEQKKYCDTPIWVQRLTNKINGKLIEENRLMYKKSYSAVLKMEKRMGISIEESNIRIENPEKSKVISDSDKKFVEAFSSAALPDTVFEQLLSASNKFKNQDVKLEKIHNYATKLIELKVTEVDLFLALDHVIENSEKNAFPTYHKLKLRIFGKD